MAFAFFCTRLKDASRKGNIFPGGRVVLRSHHKGILSIKQGLTLDVAVARRLLGNAPECSLTALKAAAIRLNRYGGLAHANGKDRV